MITKMHTFLKNLLDPEDFVFVSFIMISSNYYFI